jgi:hypothetical protein
MARPQHTHSPAYQEEAVTILFRIVDATYALLNPCAQHQRESLLSTTTASQHVDSLGPTKEVIRCGIPGLLGPGLCRILHTDFLEFAF